MPRNTVLDVVTFSEGINRRIEIHLVLLIQLSTSSVGKTGVLTYILCMDGIFNPKSLHH